MIRQMKKATPPILPRRGQPPRPNVVACAIALSRGERFDGGERTAKLRFGVHPDTELQDLSARPALKRAAWAG